jgi:hypothetical protein
VSDRLDLLDGIWASLAPEAELDLANLPIPIRRRSSARRPTADNSAFAQRPPMRAAFKVAFCDLECLAY